MNSRILWNCKEKEDLYILIYRKLSQLHCQVKKKINTYDFTEDIQESILLPNNYWTSRNCLKVNILELWSSVKHSDHLQQSLTKGLVI